MNDEGSLSTLLTLPVARARPTMLHLPRFLRVFLIISAIIGIPSIYFVYTSSDSIGPDSDLTARTEVHWDAGGAAPAISEQFMEESLSDWNPEGVTTELVGQMM